MLKHSLLRSCVVGLALLLATSSWGATEEYGYPIKDRFVATVVGTPDGYLADLPDKIPFRTRRALIFPDRQVPDAFFYDRQMLYSVALQRKAAPLIFLIAGTGSSHNGATNKGMAKAFYQAGFHVVSLSSPTFSNFVISASFTGVPGHAEHDAEDLYRAMEKIHTLLLEVNNIEITGFNLTGYSLGGFNAAYVAKLDEERKSFNFDRVLLINPPVSLYNSISLLDRMAENIPGGVDNFNLFFEDLLRGFGELYKRADSTVDSGNFLYAAYQALDLQDEELAALVGTAFRLSSASMVFASDVMTDFGYVKPRGMKLDRNSDLAHFQQVMNRLGFTDYYHEYFYPYYRDNENAGSRDAFIESESLTRIEDYLRNTPKISMVSNEDDIILEPGEIDFFRDVFGDRAKIYPYGGHCGNMSYRDNVAHMIDTFTR
jgi:hypothetical protein